MAESDESNQGNSEELPWISDEFRKKSMPLFHVDLDIPYSSSSDLDQSNDGNKSASDSQSNDGNKSVSESQNVFVEVDESQEVRKNKRRYEEIQIDESYENREKWQNKNADTAYCNDQLEENTYEQEQEHNEQAYRMMMSILQMKSIKITKMDRVIVSSIQQKMMKICFLLRKSIYTGFCNKMIFCHMGSGGDVSTGRPSSPFMVANN